MTKIIAVLTFAAFLALLGQGAGSHAASTLQKHNAAIEQAADY